MADAFSAWGRATSPLGAQGVRTCKSRKAWLKCTCSSSQCVSLRPGGDVHLPPRSPQANPQRVPCEQTHARLSQRQEGRKTTLAKSARVTSTLFAPVLSAPRGYLSTKAGYCFGAGTDGACASRDTVIAAAGTSVGPSRADTTPSIETSPHGEERAGCRRALPREQG